jgi:hypothetical protein
MRQVRLSENAFVVTDSQTVILRISFRVRFCKGMVYCSALIGKSVFLRVVQSRRRQHAALSSQRAIAWLTAIR